MSKFGHKGKEEKPPFKYTMCGLDDIYLVSGYEIEEGDYGRGVVIHDQDDLHKAIGHYLTVCQKTLNGKEVRFLRHEMDLTQTELGRILRVTDQTVARWEKGEVAIPGPEELLVRGLFVTHRSGDLDIAKLSAQLEAIEDSTRAKHVFASTEKGWQKIAA